MWLNSVAQISGLFPACYKDVRFFFSYPKKMSQRVHSVNTGESSNYETGVPASVSSNTGSTKRKEISVSFLYGSDDRSSSVSAPPKIEVRRRSRRFRTRQATFTPSLSPCLSTSDDQVVPGSPINEQPLSKNEQRVPGSPLNYQPLSVDESTGDHVKATKTAVQDRLLSPVLRMSSVQLSQCSETDRLTTCSQPPMKKEYHELHPGPPDDVTDEIVRCYGGPVRNPKTPYLRSFSVENVWSGSSNGIRTVQFAREQDHVHSRERKCEHTVAASGSPGYVSLLGHLSDMVQSETSVQEQEVRTFLSEMIRLMKSQIAAMERKLAQDRKDLEVNNVQGLPTLHMRVEMMLLKRRVDSRKETLLGMEEWRNDYVC
jgi:hypothetical protein